MRYILLALVMGMTSAVVMASEGPLFGKHDVNYDCHFRSNHKKGVTCTVKGEVCVDFGNVPTANVVDTCDKNRDDNRMTIECTDGLTDNDRASAVIKTGSDKDEDLVITSDKDKDDHGSQEIVDVESFKKFDGDHDKDDRFSASLTWSDGDHDPKLWGSCRLSLEKSGQP